ncbi:MAG: hypothetical protein Q9173_002721 [Seirophora scorigena]
MELDTVTRLSKWDARLFPTGLTVGELIDVLGAPPASDGDNKDNQQRKKYGLMEVHELGGGRWAAGQVVLRGSERAGKTLREMGWGETRGFAAKPVWLKIHEEGI